LKLAVFILLLSAALLVSTVSAQPPSAPLIRADLYNTDGSTKAPMEVQALPATPCNSGSSVILDQAGTLDSQIYVCDDRGAGLDWHPTAAVVSVTNERQVYVAFSASSMENDGTICQEPTTLSITTQNAQTAKHRFMQCTSASASGKITASIGLGGDVKASSTIDFYLVGLNNATTPSGSIDFDVWAKCEDGASDLATINFGTAQQATLEFSGVAQERWVTSSGGTAITLTPGGTCGPFSVLTVQMKMLAGAGQSDAALNNVFLYEILAAYTAVGF
jgi:hypothetical protein